jgi:hypothetical protein
MIKWPTKAQSHVPPETNNPPWRPVQQPPRNPDDDDKYIEYFILKTFFSFFIL